MGTFELIYSDNNGASKTLRLNYIINVATFRKKFIEFISEFSDDWSQIEEIASFLTNKNEIQLLFRLSSNIDHSTKNKFDVELEKQQKLLFSLTKRELAILCFIYRGYQQFQISYILEIAINTFRHHRKSLYKKMGFRNKVELAIWSEKYLLRLFRTVHKL